MSTIAPSRSRDYPAARSPAPRRFHRRAPFALIAVLLAGVLTNGTAAGSATRTAETPLPAAAAVDPGINPLVPQSRPLSRIVYGYLPYWRLDGTIAGRLQYDLLSTIAFFGLGIKADGNIDTAWRGYTAYLSDDAVAVTNAAHAAGVRVVPTFQLFDSSSLTKMTAFLQSPTARKRFVGQALELMERRSGDGANIDFEPVPESIAPAFLSFVQQFGTAMRARFPGSTLVVATSAGAGGTLTRGLVPLVDQMFVMTYNYHYAASSAAGPIAPLDNATRTVKIHIERFLSRAPASKIIMGEGFYGYDWPVTSTDPYATVRSNRSAYGGAWSVTYSSAHNWLNDHPTVTLRRDTVQGSSWFTYYDSKYKTHRQVYFEDAWSVAAKDDYALARNLAGIGIWTLGNDGTYPGMWNVIRSKFYSPTHILSVRAKASNVRRSNAKVYVDVWSTVANHGSVPEKGTLTWTIRDSKGRARTHGSRTVTIYPGRTSSSTKHGVLLGYASSLPAGTYSVQSRFVTSTKTYPGTTTTFKQPY